MDPNAGFEALDPKENPDPPVLPAALAGELPAELPNPNVEGELPALLLVFWPNENDGLEAELVALPAALFPKENWPPVLPLPLLF